MSERSFVHLHVHTEYSMLDGAARLKPMFAEVVRHGMAAIAMTDHGNLYGAYDFFKQAKSAGVKPIIGIEAYVAPASRFDKRPIFWGEPHQRDDDVSASGSYTHMTMHGRRRRWAAQPFPDRVAVQHRGSLPQAPDRPGAALDVRPGHHRHDRLPVRRGPDPAAARPVRRGGHGGGRLPRHLRAGQLLPRADGARPRHRAPGPRRPAPARQRARPAAAGHQRLALRHARTTRSRTRRCCACRPARRWPTRPGSSSTATATT